MCSVESLGSWTMATPDDEQEPGGLDWGHDEFAAAWSGHRDERWWDEQVHDEEVNGTWPRRRSRPVRLAALLVVVAMGVGSVGAWIGIVAGGDRESTRLN